MLNLSTIDYIVNNIESEGISKYVHAQHLEIVSEIKVWINKSLI